VLPNVKKWANLPLPLNVQKPKMLQLQMGFAALHDSMTRGFAPRSRWGLGLQTPIIGSRSSSPQILQARTAAA